MTYCVALRVERGLALISDSRTNAGVDHIASFRKLHVFQIPDERIIFIQSAGNLATTQSVITRLQQQLKNSEHNLLSVPTLFDVAEMVGKAVRQVIQRDTGQTQGVDFNCSLLVSGQIKGDDMRLFHIYPEGNFIEATEDTPYFQLGESKYGKPILDRVMTYSTELMRALQCGLISMDSTLRSNMTVGLPVDYLVYPVDSLQTPDVIRVDEHDQAYIQLRTLWSEGMRELFDGLPVIMPKSL